MKTWQVIVTVETPDDWDPQDVLNVVEPAFNSQEGLHAVVEEMELL